MARSAYVYVVYSPDSQVVGCGTVKYEVESMAIRWAHDRGLSLDALEMHRHRDGEAGTGANCEWSPSE